MKGSGLLQALYVETAGSRRMPLRVSRLLAWLLFTASVCRLKMTSGAEMPGCKGRKIAIVDLDMFADTTKGRPPCYPNTLKVAIAERFSTGSHGVYLSANPFT